MHTAWHWFCILLHNRLKVTNLVLKSKRFLGNDIAKKLKLFKIKFAITVFSTYWLSIYLQILLSLKYLPTYLGIMESSHSPQEYGGLFYQT